MGGARHVKYTDEHREFVKSAWAEGKSAAKVVRELAAAFGLVCSRNAILGLVNRMGLPTRPTTGPWRQNAERHARQEQAFKTAFLGQFEAPGANPEPVTEIIPLTEPAPIGLVGDFPEAGCCKWPAGTGSELQFCGHPQQGRGPYCPFHMKKRRAAQQPRKILGTGRQSRAFR